MSASAYLPRGSAISQVNLKPLSKQRAMDMDRTSEEWAAGAVAEEIGLIYDSSSAGHRETNQKLLANLLKLQPYCARLNLRTAFLIFRSPRLLLATFDDHAAMFAMLGVARGLAGRPTVGFFLRPHDSLRSGNLKQRMKGWGCRIIKRIPHFKLITFTPFAIEPQFEKVAHFGVHDPQYWDQHDGTKLRSPCTTELSSELLRLAAGRRILVFPGYITRDKGFPFCTEILNQHPELRKDVLFVAAGRVQPDTQAEARLFVTSGGHLVDRRIADAEIESLYGIADFVWCCYTPDYDQASGIFGRAVQFNVRVIVRRNSLIARVASALDCPCVALDYGDVQEGGRLLMAEYPQKTRPSAAHADTIGTWRLKFIQRVEQVLGKTKLGR
jgi:hypothetical protein